MRQLVYLVTAYRWGDRDNHSYVVGAFSKKHPALKAAELESESRGGKYLCEVLEWELDAGGRGAEVRYAAKIILALPNVNVLEEAGALRRSK